MTKALIVITCLLVFLLFTAVSPADNSRIFALVTKGDLVKVRAMIKAEPSLVNVSDKGGATPLHYAAAAGHKQMAEYLLNRKADVNAAKKDGVTPLHIAASLGRTEVVRLLLSRSANTNACDDAGRTPRMLAEANGHKEIVKLLTADEPAGSKTDSSEAAQKPEDLITVRARIFVEEMARGNYAAVTACFDDRLSSTLPAETLKAIWDSLVDQIGEFKGQLGVRTSKVEGQDAVAVTCRFEDAGLDIQFVFDSDKRVTALLLLPVVK